MAEKTQQERVDDRLLTRNDLADFALEPGRDIVDERRVEGRFESIHGNR